MIQCFRNWFYSQKNILLYLCYYLSLELSPKHDISQQEIDQECSDNDDTFSELEEKSNNSKKIKLTENEFEPIALETQTCQKKPARSETTYLTIDRDFLLNDKSRDFQMNPAKCFHNWDNMSVSEKGKIAYDLEKKSKEVRKTYTKLICKLCDSFINRGVQTTRVQMVASSYGCYDGRFQLSKDDDMFAVFQAYLPRNPWFNFELFSLIVEVIGNETEKELFQEYEQKTLIPYLHQCIFAIPFEQSISPQQPVGLFLKVVDDILLTGLEVKSTQYYLADMLGLSYSTFVFEFYKFGCFELFFNVSNTTFNPLQSHFLEWDSLKEAFKVTIDLVTIL